jgi:WS/DGAT/MGAT family acyltransferase
VERLSDEDVAILRLERGNVRGHTCKVVVVRHGLTVERLRAHVGLRLGSVPRLRQRLVETPLGLANPSWADDPDFDVARHVVPAALGARDRGLGFDGMRALVGELMAERLPRDRPLWRLDVVERMADGGGALVLRLHHAMFDGAASVRMLRAAIFDGDPPQGGTGEPPPEPFDPSQPPGWVPLTAAAARDRGLGAAAGAGRAARGLLSPAAWRSGVGEVGRLPSALAREFRRADGASPLDAEVGTSRAIGLASTTLERVKRIGKAIEGQATVNDVVLAAVAGGLRHWLERDDASLAGMRAQVPVSLHQPDEPPGVGNRDSFMVIDLPLPEPDPVARLGAIAAETRERKARHDAETLDRFFHDLGHISHRLERAAEHWAMDPRVSALSISNVPGPRERQTVCGSPLVDLYSMAEVANRHALRASVISAGGRLAFALCVDPEVVGDPMTIAHGIEHELEDLGAALL